MHKHTIEGSAASKLSGEQTANAIILNGGGYICGIQVVTDGTNNAKVIIYDNTAGSGTVICELTVVGTDHYGGRLWVPPARVDNGIYVAVSGTGASYFMDYM